MDEHPTSAVPASVPAEADLGFAPEDRRVGRRALIGLVGLGAAGVLWGAKAQSAMESVLRPVTLNDPTGLTGFVPASGRFRIYSVTGQLPSRSAADYRLAVDGLVERPSSFDIDAIRHDLPQVDLVRDFQCVTGWRVREVPWKGVTVSSVLDAVGGVKGGATHLRFWSFDGTYTETLTLEQAQRDDVLVAHELQGKPVTSEHGGPVRLYVAPMYGYKSLKWLERIEVVDKLDDPTDPGYWERRGYDTDAWVGKSNGLTDEPV